MANKIGAIRYIECSALTKDGVRKVFEVNDLSVRTFLKKRCLGSHTSCIETKER